MARAGREVWIKAVVDGIEIRNGELRVLARCGGHRASEVIHAPLGDISTLAQTECWARGIVNTSGNVLVHDDRDGFSPVGNRTSKLSKLYGVYVYELESGICRDKAPDCVMEKAGVEKICLLRAKIPGVNWEPARIAERSGLDPARMDLKAAQNLLRYLEMEAARDRPEEPQLSENTKKAILG